MKHKFNSMSRTEQNQVFLESMPKGFEGSYQDVIIRTLGCITGVLMDMSKSLAILADKEGEQNETD